MEELRKKKYRRKYLSSRTSGNLLISCYNLYACRSVVKPVINFKYLREAGNSLTICEKLLATNGVLFATASVSCYVIASWIVWTFRHAPRYSNYELPSLWCIIRGHHPPLRPLFSKFGVLCQTIPWGVLLHRRHGLLLWKWRLPLISFNEHESIITWYKPPGVNNMWLPIRHIFFSVC
jgi:hypothetical protein